MRKRKERRARCKTQSRNSKRDNEEAKENEQSQAQAEAEKEEVEVKKGFFACYLLCSLNPRFKGQTYIGFTINPRRRIRQHNGEITSGAWRTKSKRPWEMTLCIYGFPTNISALQFEWAWQHPTKSLAVRKAAADLKSLSGLANKIKLAFTMFTLPPWQSLKLTVNFFSTKYMKHSAGCPTLPKQMKVQFSLMDELPCYTDFDRNLGEEDEEEGEEEYNDKDGDSRNEQLNEASVHTTLMCQDEMTSDETNPARQMEDTASESWDDRRLPLQSTSMYPDEIRWCETDTMRHEEDTWYPSEEDWRLSLLGTSDNRDETIWPENDTARQTKDELSLNGEDRRLPLHIVDSPLTLPSSTSPCLPDTIEPVEEDSRGLIQATKQQLATHTAANEDQAQSSKRLLSSFEIDYVQPNYTSRCRIGKRQFSLVDSPMETTSCRTYDLDNHIENVQDRDVLRSIEKNSNGVEPSVATKDELPSTNHIRSSSELEVIDIVTPSPNSITHYFRKKKRASLVSNNISRYFSCEKKTFLLREKNIYDAVSVANAYCFNKKGDHFARLSSCVQLYP